LGCAFAEDFDAAFLAATFLPFGLAGAEELDRDREELELDDEELSLELEAERLLPLDSDDLFDDDLEVCLVGAIRLYEIVLPSRQH
jgi:hypothetical protein